MAYSIEDDDPDSPGLAEERTELAWNRSILSAVVLVASLSKRAWDRLETPTARTVGLVCVALAAGAWFAAVAQSARAQHRLPPLPRVGTSTLRRMTVGTVLFASAGVILSLWY